MPTTIGNRRHEVDRRAPWLGQGANPKRDAKAVLTEDQRARIDQMHERIKAHGKKAGHHGDSSKGKKCKKARATKPAATRK